MGGTADNIPIKRSEEHLPLPVDCIEVDFSDFHDRRVTVKPMKTREECLRKINEYTLEGEYVTTYESIAEAARKNNVSTSAIQACCSGKLLFCQKRKTIWLYREDDIENRLKQMEQALKAKSAKAHKIDEYDLKGKFLFTYPSIKIAARVNHIPAVRISKCCKGTVPLVNNNRIYLFHDEDIRERLSVVKEYLHQQSLRKVRERPVDEYTLEGKYTKGYNSLTQAAKSTGIDVSKICRCCKGNRYTAGSRIFLYTGDSISERIDLINSLKDSNYDKK